MKLEKDDFGIWDNDDEELSIIKEGYTSREISDYILSLQDELDRLLIKYDEVREELGNMKLSKCEDRKWINILKRITWHIDSTLPGPWVWA